MKKSSFIGERHTHTHNVIMLYVTLLCTAARGQCPWPENIDWSRPETYRIVGTTTPNAPAEVELCRVCLVAPRQDFALVPCGHRVSARVVQ